MKTFTFLAVLLLTASLLQAQYPHRKLVPSQYPTIQSAIIAASQGDTVLVADSTYKEQINFLGKKPLMVASYYLLTGDTNHIYNTIIDGSSVASYDTGSIVSFKSGEDTTSVLCGFTITKGIRGTLRTVNGEICRIGGGIFIDHSGAKIIHNRIHSNSLGAGSGGSTIAVGAGIGTNSNIDTNWVVIDHNTIKNNGVTSSLNQAAGAGIACTYNAIIKNNLITGNVVTCTGSAYPAGGGCFLGGDYPWNSGLTAYVYDNVIKGNEASGDYSAVRGGGISFQAIKAIVYNNIVEGNKALSPPNLSMGYGGGFGFIGTKTGTVVSNNTFLDNISQGAGGALEISGDAAISGVDSVLIEKNYFLNNYGGNGGGIFIEFGKHRMENNVFFSNKADEWGGAICLVNGITGPPQSNMGVVSNCTFSGNHTTDAESYGGAIFSFKGKPVVINSVFWGDSCLSALSKEIGVSLPTDILFGLNGGGDTLEIANSNIDLTIVRGPYIDGSGNITGDPDFDVSDTLNLMPGSPCVDEGTPGYTMKNGTFIQSPALDIHGKKRPNDIYYDMGAYELPPYVGIMIIDKPRLALSNAPNPFDHSTTISYSLPNAGQVSLKILDLNGNVIAELLSTYQAPGDHIFTWDSGTISPGIYLCRLEVNGKVAVCKVVKW